MISKSRIKDIQSLSQKKFRREASYFIVEGPKSVQEILKIAPSSVNEIFASPDFDISLLAGKPYTEVAPFELEKISQLTQPNQVLALVRKPTLLPEAFKPAGKISLLLETIQDPGNMGTILRAADWFGIHQVVATPDSVDFYHPKVVQSTMGSILRVNCFEMPVEEILLKAGSIPLWGATLSGNDIRQLKRPEEAILVIGNESKGISPTLLSNLHQELTIPRFGEAESLNAAMAAGILLSWLRLSP